ncbi:MAG: hypothetical protein WBP72_15905 [Rhodocyclaceae bacterium]
MQQGLNRDGYTVDWRRDGPEAERALANGVHSSLLLDLDLPRSGKAAAHAENLPGDAVEHDPFAASGVALASFAACRAPD